MFVYDSFVDVTSYDTLEKFEDNYWTSYGIRFPVMYAVCILVIPLCLLKDISKMKNASIFSIISLFYAIFVSFFIYIKIYH